MSTFNNRTRLLVAAIILAASGCGGSSAIPAGGSYSAQEVVASAGSSAAVDTTSILKKLKKDVEIGSTVDSKNGDTGPRAISLVVSSFGLKKGQLLVCNFDDSAGTAGKGSTIEVLDPTPNSKPRTFAQTNRIEGCDGSAVDSTNEVFGAGRTSGVIEEFNESGKLEESFGSPIEAPLNDAYAFCGLAYATAHVYVSNGKTGAIVQLAFTPVTGKFMVLQSISGFAVNHGSGWSALGPSGFQYNNKKYDHNQLCVDTLYIVDGVNNTIVAVYNASQLAEKDEIVVEPGGKKFVCHAPKGKLRPCARLVYSGSPLNAPVAQALLPNGNLIVANTKGGNTLVELTPTGKILDTKKIDTNKTADIFGLLAEGTDDSNTVLYYTDTKTNTLQKLEQ
jgi:hypothetical protein